jgi:hypothetical protein
MAASPAGRSRATAGITPDEAQMLRKRQDWRGRVLALCLERIAEGGGGPPAPATRAVRPQERFARLAQAIRRDMHRLLQTEMAVPELEAHRHGANYFLDHLILFVRKRSELRHQQLGLPPAPPLESLSPEQLEAEVAVALELSVEALPVFLNDLVRLQEFELEVGHQRRRLQFLLGCDRSLRDLAQSNAEIIDAPPDQLEEIAGEFFRICRHLAVDLPALLGEESPFPRLAQELEAAREQLATLVRESIEPAEAVRSAVAELEEQLRPAAESVGELAQRVDAVLGLAHRVLQGVQSGAWQQRQLPQYGRLRTALVELEAAAGTLRKGVLAAVSQRVAGIRRPDLRRQLQALSRCLPELGDELSGPTWEASRTAGQACEKALAAAGAAPPAQLETALSVLGERLQRFQRHALRPALAAFDDLTQANLLLLKECICQELGSIRATFLQPRFAHIAASDPRSTHTPQYFYFREFADEAARSEDLLRFMHALWQLVEELQETPIEGLRFSPRNLNRIAGRVLLERRSVPAGPGWRELAAFLASLKDKLVPRLQLACALPGIRYDDRDQLATFADCLTRSCGELLAQRDSASRLVDELAALAASLEVDGEVHAAYQEAVLGVSCEEMALRLREISRTLMELVPYIGAMIGGIRMRTSLAFARDRDLLPAG